MSRLLEVVCPQGVLAGDLVSITTAEGESFSVALPENVGEGQTFQVEIAADGVASGLDPVGDAPGGLGAIAAEIAGARAIAAAFFGGEPEEVKGGEVLAEALRVVLKEISNMDELDEFIDGNAAGFADFEAGDEQRLEWTSAFHRYVELIERATVTALEDLECSAEEVLEYARAFRGSDGAEHERLMSRLLNMSDYQAFCKMMREQHDCGGMGV